MVHIFKEETQTRRKIEMVYDRNLFYVTGSLRFLAFTRIIVIWVKVCVLVNKHKSYSTPVVI